MSAQAETSDEVLLNYLRRNGAARISDLVAETGVTATAVRQRIQRLMDEGLIERQAEKIGRGRPNHRYALTEKGERQAGQQFSRPGRRCSGKRSNRSPTRRFDVGC